MSMQDIHPLLKRQLKRIARRTPGGKVGMQDLLELISQKYHDADTAQARLERSIAGTSEELGALYQEAKQGRSAAEDANLSKSLFLANMSHEIRTPLNGVLGFASLLLSTDLTETQREYLNIIQSSGSSLLFLLNDILDLSKIESGSIVLESISFNMQNVVGSCVDIFRGQLCDHDVDMNTYIDPQLARSYMGDPERLTQILTNFVSNALKFTTEGSVGVEVHAMPGKEKDVQPIQIRVIDTGIGISAEKRDLIFENFAQADLSTTREYGGTGLGLSISKHLATMMGGEITIESTLGEGSTFILDVMLAEAQDSVGTIMSEYDTAALKGKKVLVVDDTAINRRYFEAQLQDYGMVCVTANSCDEALEYLENHGKEIDIIVTDHLMPDKDGLELIREIRTNSSIPEIPIILSSSSGLAGVQHSDAGYDALVAKPVVQKTFLDKLNYLLQGPNSSYGKLQPVRPESTATRILVAEDNFVNQRLIQQTLTGFDYIVDTVANGSEAVQAVKTLHYDMILMDIRMPIMGGVEATEQIRALDIPNAQIPIIALTADNDKGAREKYLAAGMNDYLPKPVNLSVLKDTIAKWEAEIPKEAPLPESCMSGFI